MGDATSPFIHTERGEREGERGGGRGKERKEIGKERDRIERERERERELGEQDSVGETERGREMRQAGKLINSSLSSAHLSRVQIALCCLW